MAGKEGKFFLYFSKEELKSLIAKYGTNVKEDLVKKIKADSLDTTQQTANPYIDIDTQIKQERLTNLKIKNRIDSVRATHLETFGIEPSPQAKQAIIAGATQTATPTSQAITVDVHKFLKGTFEDKFGWFHADCNRCSFRTGTGRDFESAAIRDLEAHVLQAHKEAWK